MKKLRRTVSILLSLIMVFSMFTIVPLTASAAENAFVKVTSEPTDWSGEYLLVYEVDGAPNKVFNSAANLSTGANALQAAFGVSDGNIDYDDTTAAAAVTIAKIEDTGYYSIKTASGKYIGKSDDANGIDESVSALNNTIAWDNGSVKITSSGGAIMRYNTGSSQFRYYKTATYTSQQPVQLYKLTAAEPAAPAEEPTTPAEEPTDEPVAGSTYYYLIGTMTDWQIDEDYRMFRNTSAGTFEYVLGADLVVTDEFKVVAYDGVNMTWFPEGTGNNYGENGEITVDGEYTIYFRPNYDGGDDWYYNCIYAADVTPEEPTEPAEEPTEPAKEPTTPAEEPTTPAEEPTTPAEEPTTPAEEPTEPVVTPGASTFYLVGSFTEWQTDDAYILTKNAEAEGEYMIAGVELKAGDEFKIVETNGSIFGFEPVWYPDGYDNNYVVAADGVYDVYFRPNYDGGEDWYYNCIYVAAQSDNEAEVIAAWSFDNEGKEAGAKLSEYGSSDGYAATAGEGTLTLSVDGETGRALEWSDAEYGENGDEIVPIMAAGKKNLWGAAPYIQVAVSSANYESITFTACIAGSNKAPATWQLSYSTDGETFTDIEGASITLSADKRKILTAYLDSALIPAEANGAETLYLRLTASTDTVAGGSTVDSPSGGEVAINNICVKATAVSGGESVLLGDADGDGDVTILDVTAIQRFLVNLPNASFNETAADTDGDGEVTILDATYIQRWLASLDVDFAIGGPING